MNLDNKLQMLNTYLTSVGVDVDYASPNLIAEVCRDYFPHWNVSSEDVVNLSNGLSNGPSLKDLQDAVRTVALDGAPQLDHHAAAELASLINFEQLIFNLIKADRKRC